MIQKEVFSVKRKYHDYDYPFDDYDEIDEDGFINYQDIEDLHNTQFMNSRKVFPPKGSYNHIPNNAFLLPGQELEETIKAFRKLSEYEEKDVKDIE